MRTAFALILSVFGLAMAGCNTVEGAGEDIESAGEAIDESAEGAQYE